MCEDTGCYISQDADLWPLSFSTSHSKYFFESSHVQCITSGIYSTIYCITLLAAWVNSLVLSESVAVSLDVTISSAVGQYYRAQILMRFIFIHFSHTDLDGIQCSQFKIPFMSMHNHFDFPFLILVHILLARFCSELASTMCRSEYLQNKSVHLLWLPAQA